MSDNNQSTTSIQVRDISPPCNIFAAQETEIQSTVAGPMKSSDDTTQPDDVTDPNPSHHQQFLCSSNAYTRKMTSLGGPGNSAFIAWEATKAARSMHLDCYGFDLQEKASKPTEGSTGAGTDRKPSRRPLVEARDPAIQLEERSSTSSNRDQYSPSVSVNEERVEGTNPNYSLPTIGKRLD